MPVLAIHIPAVHDQLDYLSDPKPGVEALALGWRKSDFCPVDWSGTRARRRRFNNLHSKAPGGLTNQEIRWWNSGYWAAVLISPRHAIAARHYRAAVPNQVHELEFLGRSMQLYRPKVKRVIEEVGEDLDVIEFATDLPRVDLAIADRIADMRTARKGLRVWLQTSQHMNFQLALDQVAVVKETGGATWAAYYTSQPAPDGVSSGAGPNGDLYAFGGDSGSPTFTFDRWGRQCLVGLHWASPTIGAGGTSKPGREFDSLRQLVGEHGFELELCDVSSPDPDIDGDGSVGAADVAVVLAEWGRSFSRADLNADGTVDARDLATVLAGWNTT